MEDFLKTVIGKSAHAKHFSVVVGRNELPEFFETVVSSGDTYPDFTLSYREQNDEYVIDFKVWDHGAS